MPPLPEGGFDLHVDVLWESDLEQPGDTLELVVLAEGEAELAHLWWSAVDPRGVWMHENIWVAVPPETGTIEFAFIARMDETVPSLFVVDNVEAVVCWPVPVWYLPIVLKG